MWAERHPREYRIIQSRRQAKLRGHEFSISVDDLEWPTHCPVLGIELDYRIKTGKKGPYNSSVSIDRIDNTKGYIPGNVRVISYRANRLKDNMTIEEARKVLKDLEAHFG